MAGGPGPAAQHARRAMGTRHRRGHPGGSAILEDQAGSIAALTALPASSYVCPRAPGLTAVSRDVTLKCHCNTTPKVPMSKLVPITIACAEYDRTRAIKDGRVRIDG